MNGEGFAFACWYRNCFPFMSSGPQPNFNLCALDDWRFMHE